MNGYSPSVVAIGGGVVQIFDHVENDGPMWTGRGKRWARAVVRFTEPFSDPPTIQLSPTVIDADTKHNLRLDVHSEDVTCDGFTAVAHTWNDTRIGRLQVNWTAIGARTDKAMDRWDV